MDKVRISGSGAEINIIVQPSGDVWVLANSGGISTFEADDPTWAKAWKLDSGTSYPAELKVWNDVPGHWLWEPVRDMPLGDYRRALASVNGSFTRIR